MIIRVLIGLVGAFKDEQNIFYIHQEMFSDRNEGMLWMFWFPYNVSSLFIKFSLSIDKYLIINSNSMLQ